MYLSKIPVCIDHTLGDSVTADNATKNIDQDRFDIRILEDDPEAVFHAFGISRSTDVQELCRTSATEFDNIHCRHGQSGTIDHTSHIPVELNKIEIIFLGFDFDGIFFGLIAHICEIRMPEESIVIEAHLAVHGNDIAISVDEQRI